MTTRNSPKTVDRILDAAAACFLDFGQRRTTMSEIAARSGLSRATIYAQIGDRRAVTAALLRRELERLRAELTRVLAAQPTEEDLLVEAIATTVEFARDDALFRRLIQLEPDLVLPWLTSRSAVVMRWGVDVLMPYVSHGMERGVLRPGEPQVAAEWLIRVALSLITTPSLTVTYAPDTVRDLIRRFAVAGFILHDNGNSPDRREAKQRFSANPA